MMEQFEASIKAGQVFEWRKWTELLPFIYWPSEWGVKAIPPFTGAVVRYLIKTPRCERVSVYLDCYDLLGFFGEPYWEVFPVDGDVARCAMNETKELLDLVEKAGAQ